MAQYNGVSESRNCTVLDMVQSIINMTDLPLSDWGHVLETTIYLLNRVSIKSVTKSRNELWTNRKTECKTLDDIEISWNLEQIDVYL